MKLSHLLAGTLLLWANAFSAQSFVSPENADIKFSPKDNSPIFIRLEKPVAIDHLSWLQTHLPVSNNQAWQLVKEDKPDALGLTKFSFAQTIQGIPVDGALYFLQSKAGAIHTASGHWIPEVSCIPQYQPLEHISSAIKSNLKSLGWDETTIKSSELKIYNHAGTWRTAYIMFVDAHKPFALRHVIADATTGEILRDVNRHTCVDTPGEAHTYHYGIKTITADSFSEGYRLYDNARGIHTWDLNNGFETFNAVEFVDEDNIWNSTLNNDHAALDAHWGLEQVYEYYLGTHNRDSYDNAHGEINAYVHVLLNYNNAFWDGSSMNFGDGDPADGYKPFTSLDVVAHEFTHGVTQYTAALDYIDESGALNEAFSDIFGVAVDYFGNPEGANFLMGEMLNENGVPFRNMMAPNASHQPDTYQGLFWKFGTEDNGGVHTNSQVANYWFYLLCNGGNGTTEFGSPYMIAPIGIENAGRIAYRTLATYLLNYSNYADAYTYSVEAATDLFGPCSHEVKQVKNAWYAVGIGEPDNSSPNPIFSAERYYCSVPATVFFENNSQGASTYFWNFGDGGTSTATSAVHTYTTPGVYAVTLDASGSGTCANSSSLVVQEYIIVSDHALPIEAACIPPSNQWSDSTGIQLVQVGSIDVLSGNATEPYEDFTCQGYTELVAGDLSEMFVSTLADELVRVSIDYNQNGTFEENEVLFTSTDFEREHVILFTTDVNTALNTPMRLRVQSSRDVFPVSCANGLNGQTEDYTVVFVPNTLPPLADFTVNSTAIGPGESVQFTSLSVHAPQTFTWSFPGGTPSTSNQINPSVTYNNIGVFPVTLVVANEFGTDEETKTAYIYVNNNFFQCEANSSSTSSGILYDSGGADGNYDDNEYCGFLIAPTCGEQLSLTIEEMYTEEGYDYLSIYDGDSNAGSILFQQSGYFTNQTFTSTTGAFFVEFASDPGVTTSGYRISWSAGASGIEAIQVTGTTEVNQSLSFTAGDLSNFAVSWNFGDGNLSFEDTPTHTYTEPGVYIVSLHVVDGNCAYDFFKTIEIGPNSIAENNLKTGVKLYPNPTTGNTNLILESADLWSNASLFDLTGKLMFSTNINSHKVEIPTAQEASGMYYLRLTGSQQSIVVPIVKSN